MFLAKMSVTRPILTTMILMVFIIFGYISYNKLNLELFPKVDIPVVTISTIYPGAGPKEIETLVTKKIEDAVSSISQINKIESYCLDGFSLVMIEFTLDKDIDIANQEVKDKVDEIANFLPKDAKKPLIQKFDIGAQPIVELTLRGDKSLSELYDIADKKLKDRFAQIRGVGKVDIVGGQEREIQIKFDSKTVYENAVSLPYLMQVLQSQNMDIPGGDFKSSTQEYTVRVDGRLNSTESILDLDIPTPFGMKKLRQLGEVYDDGKEIKKRAIYFDAVNNVRDENTVKLSIIKSADGNVVKVADGVRESLPEINASLPPGIQLDMIKDESGFVRSTAEDTLTNIILGVLITSLVLFYFLHDLRSTIIISLSMPASILSTFLLMDYAGFSLNIMSLMGISVSVGVLVANSVVVLENIFRYKRMGYSTLEAAEKGTSEVAVAVIASTLTNIVVFVPLAFMQSMVGKFLYELAMTAAFATIFSLVTSFTLTPLLASVLLPNKEKKLGLLGRLIEANALFWERLYEKTLVLMMKNKWISSGVVVLTFIFFYLTMVTISGRIGNEFMPPVDKGLFKIEVELPNGYNLEATGKITQEIEKRLAIHPELVWTLSSLGETSPMDVGSNLAVMMVQIVGASEREIHINDYINMISLELADIPNANIKVSMADDTGGGQAPIEFFLLGQDLDVLEKLKLDVISKVEKVKGIANFDNSSRAGRPELTITPMRDKLADAGLTISELAYTVRASIEGLESSKYRDKGDEYDITVMLFEESTNSPENIANIPIVSPKGTFRLSQLAEIKFTEGFAKILHRDKYTAIKFSGYDGAGVPLGNIIDDLKAEFANLELPPGYKIKWSGISEMQQELMMDMGFAFMLAILLTYMLLAATLESFAQPLLILITVVLAMIGVWLALYYTRTSFGITSMMGVIMLIGIVVNAGIIMLDYVNQLVREEGMSAKDALIKGCPTKLKPIMMSSAAVMLGMLPMALGVGDAGAEWRQPLGVVSIGGLAVSTLLTLWVVPALYFVFSRKKKKEDDEVPALQ